MATALQQQLAAINAKSTDQLNLKAQKARHARSLLFEPREAAGQSFDTIFQVCHEGFSELCQLDGRFRPFVQNLFADDSVGVEREHMTATENENLDRVLEQFLGLVSGRLLLRPALKSVEWLVRRWKVQEYNTDTTLFAFLPYYGHDIFPTLLSILPKQLSATFDFLRPYVASLQCPPRHAIVAAAVRRPAFLADFSSFVLRAARRRHQSSGLIGLWASVLAQTVNGMLDAAQSGREAVRRQKLEDVLLRVLPILQDMLCVPDAPELFLAACMVMTILATKADLDDRVLDALMESVVGAWTPDTVGDGIECLAVLAEERTAVELPVKVAQSIVESDQGLTCLIALSRKLRVDNLVLGFVLGVLDLLESKHQPKYAEAVNKLLGNIALPKTQLDVAHRRLASTRRSLLKQGHPPELQETLDSLLGRNVTNGKYLDTDEADDVDMIDTQLSASDSSTQAELENGIDTTETLQEIQDTDHQQLISKLPELPKASCSFLDREPEVRNLASEYLRAFESCSSSGLGMENFLALPSLHRDTAMKRPEMLSLMALVWCTSSVKKAARTKAIEVAAQVLRSLPTEMALDFQALIPYLLHALSDQSQMVRKAAAQLAVTVADSYKIKSNKAKAGNNIEVWGKDTIYGSQSPSVHWLSSTDAHHFFKAMVDPCLEGCLLDPSLVSKSLSESLNTAEAKSATRSLICECLATHAVLTDMRGAQLTVLEVLRQVRKVGTAARKSSLIPFVKHLALERTQEDAALDRAALYCLTHRTTEEMDALKDVASNARMTVASIAFERLGDIFNHMTAEAEALTADFLLDQALAPNESETAGEDRASASLGTLRSLSIPTGTLAHLLESVLATSSSHGTERPLKRQRTSKSTTEKAPKDVDVAKLNPMLRSATLALELVEDAFSAQEPSGKHRRAEDGEASVLVLKSLFHMLGELHQWKTMTGSDLTYLQTLIFGAMLAVLTMLDHSMWKAIDRSFVRADIIVETIRSTSSPQVHNNALLVISRIAMFAPDAVLHSVMPLFTFMSSSTLRQADAYSAHVIDMTIENIVPPLAASLKKKGRNLVAGASELLLSFTAAFEHIPMHRRVSTFVQLVKTLGPEDVLFAVMAMLVERYRDDTSLGGAIREIISSFSIEAQMNALKQYLGLVLDACTQKKKLADTILGFGEKNAAEITESVSVLLEGFATLVLNANTRRRIAAEMSNPDAAEELRAVYGVLLEQTVSLPLHKERTVNFEEPRLKRAHESALEGLLGLLPTEEFISSSAVLMQGGSEQVRRKVFASLTARVNQAKAGRSELAQVFVDSLPNCSAFLSTTQPVGVRQAAMQCVDAICEKFGKRDRDAVKIVAMVVAGPAALESEDLSLRISALLCLASTVEVLGEEMVALAPQVLKVATGYLDDTVRSAKIAWILVDAAFSFANALLDHQAWLLSTEQLDRLLILAGITLEMNREDAWPVEQFRSLAPKKVDAPVFLAALARSFFAVREVGASATEAQVKMLHAAVKNNTKGSLTRHSESFFTVLLQAFSLRRDYALAHGDEAAERLQGAYDMTTQTALDMTLKLNDSTFRPFFMRLVEWSAEELPNDDGSGNIRRGISLFDFSQRLFEQLGSIVTGYGSFIMDDAAAALKNAHEESHDKQRRGLVGKVLDTLSASFRHDQDDFWAAPHNFDAVATPLLELVAKPAAAARDDGVIPVVVDLASAVSGSADHLKSMNGRIMSDLRHKDAAVRLEAVKCERAITERLTFDWLNLLPEMLPFISELLEDDDDAVEREAVRWVAQIEEITGESLEGMLA